MTQETPTLYLKLQTKEGQEWKSGLSWQEMIERLTNVETSLNALSSRLDRLAMPIQRLQEASEDKIIQYMKPITIALIEKDYGTKAFYPWKLKDKLETQGFGFMASMHVIDQLVKDGALTYKHGWYRLSRAVKS